VLVEKLASRLLGLDFRPTWLFFQFSFGDFDVDFVRISVSKCLYLYLLLSELLYSPTSQVQNEKTLLVSIHYLTSLLDDQEQTVPRFGHSLRTVKLDTCRCRFITKSTVYKTLALFGLDRFDFELEQVMRLEMLLKSFIMHSEREL